MKLFNMFGPARIGDYSPQEYIVRLLVVVAIASPETRGGLLVDLFARPR